jgi:hypothetical protein
MVEDNRFEAVVRDRGWAARAPNHRRENHLRLPRLKLYWD